MKMPPSKVAPAGRSPRNMPASIECGNVVSVVRVVTNSLPPTLSLTMSLQPAVMPGRMDWVGWAVPASGGERRRQWTAAGCAASGLIDTAGVRRSKPRRGRRRASDVLKVEEPSRPSRNGRASRQDY